MSLVCSWIQKTCQMCSLFSGAFEQQPIMFTVGCFVRFKCEAICSLNISEMWFEHASYYAIYNFTTWMHKLSESEIIYSSNIHLGEHVTISVLLSSQ